MFVGRMFFAKTGETAPDAIRDAIMRLLGALRQNGQVCGREWSIAVSAEGCLATVLLPEATSLQAVHHNKYVSRDLERLGEVGLAEPKCTTCEEIRGAGVCDCARRESLVLHTDYLSLESPLWCGDCFRPLPLYRIPPTYDDEYYDITCWESDYQACDTLQMNCSTLERAATREMSRHDSSLSKRGLEICARIRERTGLPAYYYLYRYTGRSVKQEQARCCPSCGGEWLLPEQWHDFDFKCDRCYLLSNIAMNLPQPPPSDPPHPLADGAE